MIAQTDASLGSASGSGHVILTPIWRPRLDDLAVRLLEHSYHANADVPVLFVGPEDLDVGFYRERFPRGQWQGFSPEHFSSVTSYSMWMTSTEPYEAVSGFEFVTICQQDAILLKSVTEVPMAGTDYLGAPWDPPVRVLRMGRRISVGSSFGERQGPWFTHRFGARISVGNGGLSTRRVASMIEVSRALQTAYPDRVRRGILEDVYFCALGPRMGLRVADASTAGRTYAESTADQHVLPGELVGLHGPHRWNPELLAHVLSS